MNGTVGRLPAGHHLRLTLTTVQASADGELDPCGAFGGKCRLFQNVSVRDLDTGFAAIGSNSWVPVEFDDVMIVQAGPRWEPAPVRPPVAPGVPVGVRHCFPNGLIDAAQAFDLRPDWGIRHANSGLCVAAASADANASLMLMTCNPADERQQFRNDYTTVRNAVVPFTVTTAKGKLLMTGDVSGSVSIRGAATKAAGTWQSWTYFPNSQQLRNQYTVDVNLGFPMCLAVASDNEAVGQVIQV